MTETITRRDALDSALDTIEEITRRDALDFAPDTIEEEACIWHMYSQDSTREYIKILQHMIDRLLFLYFKFSAL